jgi:delta-aminolevulinic acid dehydratase/porphobilinogen synthase
VNILQVIYTDVALDPYSSDGHDGIVREDGEYSCLLGVGTR